MKEEASFSTLRNKRGGDRIHSLFRDSAVTVTSKSLYYSTDHKLYERGAIEAQLCERPETLHNDV